MINSTTCGSFVQIFPQMDSGVFHSTLNETNGWYEWEMENQNEIVLIKDDEE